VDGGDDGLGERPHLENRRVNQLAHGGGHVETGRVAAGGDDREIEAGAEGVARARDDKDAALVARRLAYRLGEGREHFQIDGVAPLRPVEGDALDSVFECDE
jgi:hypothetical protein